MKLSFRSAGLNPGFVAVSSLAMLEILPPTGSFLMARRSPGSLTVLAVKDGSVTIARSLDLTGDSLDPIGEISNDIYPTIAYIEDQTGARPEKLLLAGFGSDAKSAATRVSIELDIPVEIVAQPEPGLAGYLARRDHRMNLASLPFRRDRPMLVASAAAAVLLAATLILLVYLASSGSTAPRRKPRRAPQPRQQRACFRPARPGQNQRGHAPGG